MWTRHFHATFLVIIGILLLIGITYISGQKPTLPKLSTTNQTTNNPTPTPQPSFLVYETTGYQNVYSYMPESGDRQFYYGAPTTTIFTNGMLYNNQLYLTNQQNAAILNLYGHSFYPTAPSSIPFTIAPSQTKAIFQEKTINPKTQKPLFLLSLVTPDNPHPQQIASTSATLTPLCWSQDEENIEFTASDQTILSLSVPHHTQTTIQPSLPSSPITHFYCNSQTNTIYMQTTMDMYKETINQTQVIPLSLPHQLLQHINPPVLFSQNTLLTATQSALHTINLDTKEDKVLYTATDSATLTPSLWQENIIVYTQENTKAENNSYYLAGKVLNTQDQVDRVFARHESPNKTDLGIILPINWLQPL